MGSLRALWVSLLSVALVAGLISIGSAPALAADGTTGNAVASAETIPPTDRGRVLELWKSGGAGVKAAAEIALTGSDSDVKYFLEQVKDEEEHKDNRVAAGQLISAGGRAVQDAALAALKGTPEDLKIFLENGWKAPLAEDQRVRVAQAIDAGGRGVQEAGRKALNGTAADIDAFLQEGQYKQRDQDERVQVAQIISVGGSNVQEAGRLALRGTPDDIRDFIAVGQYVARSRDQEHATVAQLAEQAREAGRQAAIETRAAKDASDRAFKASKAAKEDAQKAAEETSKAKGDADKAAAKAKEAASAASQAAAAAQQAISAAHAANNSARIAANASSQAASAAAGAANAAARAQQAANNAAKDKAKAQDARDAATGARTAAKGARLAATAADQASVAATAAGKAASDAVSAGGNADAAADAATEASGYLSAASAAGAEARAAADAARRHAREASRAAKAAEALAHRAATAAGESRDAANSAANHAENAAKAAEDAADHAGEADRAATQAESHAKAATDAADEATAAVTKAQTAHDLALQIESEGLTARTNAAIESARDLKAKEQKDQAKKAANAQRVKDLDTELERLGMEAAQPGADLKTTAIQGRKSALLALQLRGSWGIAAAEAALSGTDDDVVDYVRTGWKDAIAQEQRDQAEDLASGSPLQKVRDTAEKALQGDDAAVAAFLSAGQFQAAEEDLRVEIAKVIDGGGRGVQEAGRAALNSGNPLKYRDFLATGQYAARYEDERVRAAQLVDGGAPEVSSAARIALEGAAPQLHAFIQIGQYKAQQKDKLAATHVAQVEQLISDAAGVAATAQENAANARQFAALARKYADEADKAAREAAESKKKAKDYADKADASAKQAETSAAAAAASAKVARNAAAGAAQAAGRATESAAEAQVSVQGARTAAATAWNAANEARASATAAGKSAKEALAAAKDTLKIAQTKLRAEEEARRNDPAEQARERYRCGILGCEAQENPGRWCQHHEAYCDVLARGPAFEQVTKQLWKLEKDILGIGQVEGCLLDYDMDACANLMQDQVLAQKLKLLGKVADGLSDIASGCTRCFLPGTKVLLGDRTTKSIEDIQAGDEVLATDPLTGETGRRKVTQLIVTEDDKHFNELTLKTPKGLEKITATYEHPFWSPSAHQWLNASALEPGDTLLSADGTTVQVEANRAFNQHARTYTLTVDDLHSFYVLAGTTPVLVHNSECKNPIGQLGVPGQASYSRIKAAMGRVANMTPDQFRRLLTQGELDRAKKDPWLMRMFYGTALERGIARDVEVLSDGNITHLGNSMPGKPVADFRITVDGKTFDVDITGPSRSSWDDHMRRSYITSGYQIFTYPSPSNADLAEIFQLGS
ncbi:polymorphic toxin-type HINT domain-containing protein [Streptomyces crystallinus]|uniref:SCP1.201-like deaminase n=1 Tax=Streptomyces crystallinus TaxID=68191 RepID=A0ABN1GS81_9ACTN